MAIPVMILANPKGQKMKKKKKKKRSPVTTTNPRTRTRKSARRKNPSRRRRRRNPSDGVSTGSIIGGVVLGGVLAGASDYLLAGQTWAATPTRRAGIAGAICALGAGAAAATSGTARGIAAGASGAFAGVAVANLARVLGEMGLARTDNAAVKAPPATTTEAKPADAAMSGVVRPRLAAPRATTAPAAMRAVVMDSARMRALVVDPTDAMQAARRAGVTPAMLEPPRLVRPTAPGGRMGQLIVRGISR